MIRPKIFSKKLLSWSLDHPRNYPWTGEKDPYKIWISEIILQQTRSDQGKSYFENFIKKFPNVKRLAKATEDEILSSWQGLGYYSRARNLHHAAKTIVEKFKGHFPRAMENIKSIKGIGQYSAAAISSFAFDTPEAVVDGNVVRVLSRILGIDILFNSTEGKRKFFNIANIYLDKENPAAYNQAIMNFGAIHCKPKQPLCQQCIFSNQCYAYLNNCIDIFPVKLKKIVLKKRYFHYFHIENEKGEVALQQRMKKDIWQKLYELPMIETKKDQRFKSIEQIEKESDVLYFNKSLKINLIETTTQKLSHQEIKSRFYKLNSSHIPTKIKHEVCFVKRENLVNFAFPKIISVYLKNFNQNRYAE